MGRRFVLLVLSSASLLAIWFTWPLAALLGTHVAGRSVDAEQFLWSYWWFKRAIFSEHVSPFTTHLLYYPEGVSLRYFTTNTLHALISIPLQWLVGLVPAYNLIGLATFVAIVLTTAWLAYDVSGSRAGALFAGVAFAFGPTQVFHWRVGQYNMLAVEFLPVYILWLRRLTISDTWNWRALLATATSLACASLCDWQFALFLGLFTLIAVAVVLAQRPQGWRLIAGQTAVACAIAVVVLLPMMAPMLAELNDHPYMVRKESDTIFHSADVAMFLPPNPASPFWGHWSSEQLNHFTESGIVATVVSMSYVTLALAIVGAIAWRRRARSWLIIGAIFWVLALGPRLKWFGTATNIPLPYLLLFQLKLVQISRFPARYAIFTQICLAVLAAGGIAALLRRARDMPRGVWRARAALAGLAGAALVVELVPAPRYVEPLSQAPAFFTDGTLSSAGAIVEQPNPSNRGMYFQTLHGRPVLWGELSRDNPAGPLLTYLRTEPSQLQRDIFDTQRNWLCTAAAMRITHFVRYGSPPARPPAGMTLMRAGQGAALYRLDEPDMNETCVLLDSGWQDSRKLEDGTLYRWIGQAARITLLRRIPGVVTLGLHIHCFAMPRHVQLRRNGQVIAEAPACGWPPQPFDAQIDLPAGATSIEIASVEPASNPADFGYAETEPIAIGVSQLTITSR